MAIKIILPIIAVALLFAGVVVYRTATHDPTLAPGEIATRDHPGCRKLEIMLKSGQHPDRKQVLEILGRPNHLGMGGTKDSCPYTEAEMWKAPYWGYGWQEYNLPVNLEFDRTGHVIRLNYGWC